ncbi:MAG: 50S ribosomal protein L25 [Planctomycetota bacterium]
MSTETPTLEAQPRDKTGSRYAKRLRDAGRLPIVIYGHGHDPVHASVETRELHDVLASHAHLVEVNVDGKPTPCLVKDVQYDYLDRDPVHVDLAIVNLDEDVQVEVGIELTGDAVGLKQAGAMLDQQMTTLTITCKANNIPDAIIHDISELDVDVQLNVADLTLPAGVAASDDAEKLVAHIVIQVVKEEPTEEEAGDGGEPEVVEKGKKEDEGGE